MHLAGAEGHPGLTVNTVAHASPPHQPHRHPHLPTLRHRLSEERLGPYDRASGGDPTSSLRLYEWNMAISAAMFESLHVLEVRRAPPPPERWRRSTGGSPGRSPRPRTADPASPGAVPVGESARGGRSGSGGHATGPAGRRSGDGRADGRPERHDAARAATAALHTGWRSGIARTRTGAPPRPGRRTPAGRWPEAAAVPAPPPHWLWRPAAYAVARTTALVSRGQRATWRAVRGRRSVAPPCAAPDRPAAQRRLMWMVSSATDGPGTAVCSVYPSIWDSWWRT